MGPEPRRRRSALRAQAAAQSFSLRGWPQAMSLRTPCPPARDGGAAMALRVAEPDAFAFGFALVSHVQNPRPEKGLARGTCSGWICRGAVRGWWWFSCARRDAESSRRVARAFRRAPTNRFFDHR